MPMDNPILARPYTVDDLRDELTETGVKETVLVQAAPTVEETEYLLGIADSTDFVVGVVGWVNFEDKSDLVHLKRFAKHPKFVGVRPMIQDIPDDDWMLRDDIQWAYQSVVDLGLTFDGLGYPRHIRNFNRLFQKHPELRAVVDHCLKPGVSTDDTDSFHKWADEIEQLAEETNAYCKVSGLISECQTHSDLDKIIPYLAHVIKRFEPERVIWGSDWPVSLRRLSYPRGFLYVKEAVCKTLEKSCYSDNISETKNWIFGQSAATFYQLPPPK